VLHRGILDPEIKLEQKIKMWCILIDDTTNDQIKAEYIVASGIRTKEMMKVLFACDLTAEMIVKLFIEEKIRCHEIFVYVAENYLSGDVIAIEIADDGKISLSTDHEETYNGLNDGKNVCQAENKIETCEELNGCKDSTRTISSSFIEAFAEQFVRLRPKSIARILARCSKTIKLPEIMVTKNLLQRIKLRKGETLPRYVRTLCAQCAHNNNLIYECYKMIKNCRLEYNFIKELFSSDNEHIMMMKIKEMVKIYYRTVVKDREGAVTRVKEIVKNRKINFNTRNAVNNSEDENKRWYSTIQVPIYDEEVESVKTVTYNRVRKALTSFVKKYPQKRHFYKDMLFTIHYMNRDYVSALALVKNESNNKKYGCLLRISREIALDEIDKACKLEQSKELEMLRLRAIYDKNTTFITNVQHFNGSISNDYVLRDDLRNLNENNGRMDKTCADRKVNLIEMCRIAQKWDDDNLNIFCLRQIKENNDPCSFNAFLEKIKRTENVFYEKYVFCKRNSEWREAIEVLKEGIKTTRSSFLHYEHLFITDKLRSIPLAGSSSTIGLYFKIKSVISSAHANWQLEVLNVLKDALHRNGDFFIIYFDALLAVLSADCRNEMMDEKDSEQILKYFFNNLYFYISMGNWKGYYFVQIMDWSEDDILKKLFYGVELMRRDRTFYVVRNT
ncbi:hypothetical protein THOM_2050, partial [Trachipleistophora hominis]